MFALFEDRFSDGTGPAGWVFSQLENHLTGSWPQLIGAITEAQNQGLWAVVALHYELGFALEPALQRMASPKKESLPAGRVWIFKTYQPLNTPSDVENFLAKHIRKLPSAARIAGIGGLQAQCAEAEYTQAAEAVQSYIRAGDCYQINLTFPLHFSTFGHPLALYAALRENQPVRYGGVVLDNEAPILSLSPELFVEKKGGKLITRPMKGTARRGKTPEEDHQQAEWLVKNPKNRAENLMIVDLLRNDLSRLKHHSGGEPPNITVPQLFEAEPYPALWQMVSQVEARCATATTPDAKALLTALFPCGSITGAPKIRAMQIIESLEKTPRGLYTGALGWFDPQGDCRLNVAIRTLTLNTNPSASSEAPYGEGQLGIGSGLVHDSKASEEWAECWLKAEFMTALNPGIRLIETLRLEVDAQGFSYPHLPEHLKRLNHSAAWLGFACDPGDIQEKLRALAQKTSLGLWRVRVTLGKEGDVEIVLSSLLSEITSSSPLRLECSTQRIDAQHPLQRHKTTWRPYYDGALKRVQETPGLFDVLFLNQSGEVAEGARSTVFAKIKGKWLTPPLSSGALPGIWRARVLSGEVAEMTPANEAVLTLDDLRNAEALVCGNALRGAYPVVLTAPEETSHLGPKDSTQTT